MEPCQCLPDTGDSGLQVTEIEFICPEGTVSATSLQAELTIDCPEGDCPDEVDMDQCGDFDALPWSEWNDCTEKICLVDSMRQRKIRRNGTISHEFEGNGTRPLILLNSDKFDLYLPEGAVLGLFAMGGGGGADDSVSGSSGSFTYMTVTADVGRTYSVDVTIGLGGDNRSGKDTVIDIDGLDGIVGSGGGYSGGQGWSGGSSEKGGWNGGSGDSKSNGNGASLPTICNPQVTLEAGKTGDYDSDGAGGGEDNYDGYDGVAVLVLCI